MSRWLLITALSLLLAGCNDYNWRSTDISDVMPELDFELVDEDGNAVSEADYIGKTSLLFFGFTHCPDVCPITLSRLSAAIKQLDEDDRDKVQVLFVSVDPARDTPEVLKQYTGIFGPQVIGLTGGIDNIDAFTNRYRATYEYGEKDASGNYAVTHSSAVFAFDKTGQARLLMRESDPAGAIASDLKRLIEEG